MATPEQHLPGDEPTDNQAEDVSPNRRTSSRNNPKNSSVRDRLSRRSPPSAQPELPYNRSWFETSDIAPLDTLRERRGGEDRHNAPRGKPPRLDDEDLPDHPSFDVDTLRDDIADHFQDWEDNVTDLSELAQREIDILSDDEKIEKAKEIIEKNRTRYLSRKDQELTFRHEKARGWFGLQMFLGWGLSILLMGFLVVFASLFIYTTIKDGSLSDSGIVVGVLNTIQEVLRIIFDSRSGDPF